MNKFILKENSYGHRKRLQFILKQIESFKEKKDIKILDVGCGSGLLVTMPISKLGYHILGIDLDNKSIDFANKNNELANAEFKNIPVEEILDTYDIIINCEVLEHLSNPKEFLNTLKDKLNDNGMLILTTPNGYGCFEKEKAILEKILAISFFRKILSKMIKNKNQITLKDDDKHLQKFKLNDLKNLFNETHLEIIEMKGGPIMGGPITERTLAKIPGFKWLSNKLGDILPIELALVWYFVLRKTNK